MNCPICGSECDRDSVHNGVMMIYGPWGCCCGWSEDDQHNRHITNPETENGFYDQYGGFTKTKREADI